MLLRHQGQQAQPYLLHRRYDSDAIHDGFRAVDLDGDIDEQAYIGKKFMTQLLHTSNFLQYVAVKRIVFSVLAGYQNAAILTSR